MFQLDLPHTSELLSIFSFTHVYAFSEYPRSFTIFKPAQTNCSVVVAPSLWPLFGLHPRRTWRLLSNRILSCRHRKHRQGNTFKLDWDHSQWQWNCMEHEAVLAEVLSSANGFRSCLANPRTAVCLQRSSCCCSYSRFSLYNFRFKSSTSRRLCSTRFDSRCPPEIVSSLTVELTEDEPSPQLTTLG